MDIKSLINKVIASKGILRVPSWWMRKLFTEIIGYVDAKDNTNKSQITAYVNKKDTDNKKQIIEEVDTKDAANKDYLENKITELAAKLNSDLTNLKKSLHTQKCFIVKTGELGGYVVVDSVKQDLPANAEKVVTYTNTFKFNNNNLGNDNNIISIDFSVTDTSSMVDMSYMFCKCVSLTSLDLKVLNTAAVTNTGFMFAYFKMTNLNLSGFDTSKVTNMGHMFEGSSITNLNLSGFDTSKVTNMEGMFYRSEVPSLDLSGFDTSKVTNMRNMLSDCSKLTSLNLSGFDTSKVTNMGYMFSHCSKLMSLNLSGFDTSKVTNMGYMFSSCEQLRDLNLSGFDTSKVTNMERMFSWFGYIVNIELGPNFFKTSSVTSIDFSYCRNWTGNTMTTSLVTNSYDRATAGLNSLTIKLHAYTKKALTDEQKAIITSKGYTIA